MKRSATPSFALTLPLGYMEPWQHNELDKIFRIGGKLCNDLIDDRLKALRQLERLHVWRETQVEIKALYKKEQEELAGKTELEKKAAEKYADKKKALFEVRNELLKQYGFTEFSFQARIQKWRKRYTKLVNTHVAQKIASQVWKKFEDYLFGSGKEIKFVPWTIFTSIEGKSNNTAIFYKNGVLSVNKLKFTVKFAKAPKEGKAPSSYTYEQQAIGNRVKYCRLVRRWYPEGWRYFVQFILEGEPPQKVDPTTGELRHPMGKGRVGYDIGTQTIAACGDKDVALVELSPGAQRIEKDLRCINRAMDRSRRATNKDMFRTDGTIAPRNQLPSHCLDKRGRRIWNESKRYKRLSALRRYLYRRQASIRLQEHHELANRFLAYGNEHYIETMSFKGLAKRAKRQESIKPGERQKCRKRFGKSIANKAPALFVNILEQKVLTHGGSFSRINTWKAKASQYNHLNHEYNPKKLSQRWTVMPDGNKVQRDLYSAFLIQHTNSTLDGFIQDLCDKNYPHFITLHNKEIASLVGQKVPSSMDIKQ